MQMSEEQERLGLYRQATIYKYYVSASCYFIPAAKYNGIFCQLKNRRPEGLSLRERLRIRGIHPLSLKKKLNTN